MIDEIAIKKKDFFYPLSQMLSKVDLVRCLFTASVCQDGNDRLFEANADGFEAILLDIWDDLNTIKNNLYPEKEDN